MRTYLGDGVYAEHKDYAIILTTEDGIRVTNKIYLENAVYEALIEWVNALKAKEKKDE